MTSKEAMQDLRKDATKHLDHHIKYLNDRLDVIEKDLEILEILKDKLAVYFKAHYRLSVMGSLDYQRLTEEEYKLLKEWLEK